MSNQHGYSSIPNGNEQSSSNTSKPPTFLHHVRHGHLRHYVSAHKLPAIAITVIIVFTALLVGLVSYAPDLRNKDRYRYDSIQNPINIGISPALFEEGLSKCQRINKGIIDNIYNSNRTYNPRAPKDAQPVLLRNAIVWDGEGEIINNVDILMTNGVISEIKPKIQAPESAKIIDVGGNIVSPGLVDMHT